MSLLRIYHHVIISLALLFGVNVSVDVVLFAFDRLQRIRNNSSIFRVNYEENVELWLGFRESSLTATEMDTYKCYVIIFCNNKEMLGITRNNNNSCITELKR